MDIVFTVSPEQLAKAMVKGHWRTGKDGKKHWVRDYHDKRGKRLAPGQQPGAGPQVTGSAKPGTEFGEQISEHTTIEDLEDFHAEVLHGLGYDPATKSLAILNRMGIENHVVSDLSYGAWDGLEPNYRLRLPGASEDTAKFVAALLGRACDQDAVAVVSPSPSSGTFKGLLLDYPQGKAWTPADIAPIDKALSAQGVGLETSEDNRSLRFTNYEDDADDEPAQRAFAEKVAGTLETLGYQREHMSAFTGQSFLVMREEYDALVDGYGDKDGGSIAPRLREWADAQARHAYETAFAERVQSHGWHKPAGREPELAGDPGERLGKSLILFT